jgi:hypothetical protein
MPIFGHQPQIDFCVVGAIKAGTTSLFGWLGQQDQICAATPKEPHYWCAPDQPLSFRGPGQEFWLRGGVTNTDQYVSLFRHKEGLRGEASTGYLYDQNALRRLHGSCPGCKIIVSLREPVSRMHAAYRHALRDGYEPVRSFEAALKAEPERIAANWGPLYYYRRASMYAEPLKACCDIFGRESVLVIFFEDLVRRSEETLRTVADFLQISPDTWMLPHINEGLVARRPVLRKALTTAVNLARPIARTLRIGSGRYLGNRAMQAVDSLTLWKPRLTDGERTRLRLEFRDEVEKLESILGTGVPGSWRR